MARHDIIVVGAGHNGLIAAAYLARAGLDVLVCERASTVGGALANREICPGFTGAGGAHDLSVLTPRVVSDLNLTSFGLELIALPGRVTLLSDGGVIASHANRRQTLLDIERYSSRDAARYVDFDLHLARQKELFNPFLKGPLPNFSQIGAEGSEDLRFLTRPFRQMGEGSLPEALRFWFRSCKDFLDDYFETDALKAHLALPSFIGSARGPFSPGTASLLMYARLGAHVHGLQGIVRGGMQKLGEALEQSLNSFGGKVLCDSEVSEVNIIKGAASGVTLADGTAHEAKAVVSNLDLKRTFLTLFDWKTLPGATLSRVGHFRMNGSVAKMNIALDDLPEFPELATDSPLRAGKMHMTASLAEMERAFDCWKDRRVPERPPLEMILLSLSDPSLCPPGKHVLSITVQYIPNQLMDGHWDDEKREVLAHRIFDLLAEHSPALGALILGWTLEVPPDLENRFALTGGDVHHGDMAPDQLLFNRSIADYASHRTPFHNFYMCGAGTHPGGVVMGLAGALAAQTVLRDMGRAGL